MTNSPPVNPLAYQYVALRCVPRVDREEFVNVGVVLYCHSSDYLQCSWHVDPARLGALDALVNPEQLRHALTFIDAVCDGTPEAGRAGAASASQRFGFLKAPRSTVLQPGPVHGGITHDPARQLEHLLQQLVG
jgi:hypothetical protein